jgi:hypothetical protein
MARIETGESKGSGGAFVMSCACAFASANVESAAAKKPLLALTLDLQGRSLSRTARDGKRARDGRPTRAV